MDSTRLEWLLSGSSGDVSRGTLAIGGLLFVGAIGLGLSLQLFLAGRLSSWPVRSGLETITVGGKLIRVSDLTWTIYLGSVVFGIASSYRTSRINDGLLSSLAVGGAPLFGYSIGLWLYWETFTEFGYPIDSILRALIFGLVVGTVGFVLGGVRR